ncbi:hypothetical protein BC834DRAFT_902137 [Gloeopeniophorella convolvens]|nr:hypothetical protein BC834DRAFT_902137 [Gloeopeniophorella convolvens]
MYSLFSEDGVRRTTIHSLSSELLLDIFDWTRLLYLLQWRAQWKWLTITGVCSRWRQVMLASPRRLHLVLPCKDGSPVAEMLSMWPSLSLSVEYGPGYSMLPPCEDPNNVPPAFQHREKIQTLTICTFYSSSRNTIMAIDGQYPSLEALEITCIGGSSLELPSTLVAPKLRSLRLRHVTLPIDSPLLAATCLQNLQLFGLSPSSTPSFTPNNLAAQLSKMYRLHKLSMGFFRSPLELYRSQKEIQGASVTRFTLPLLRHFHFTGPVTYLEDLVDLLHSDHLEAFSSNLFDQPTFAFPNLLRFLTESTSFEPPEVVELRHNEVSLLSLGYSGPSAAFPETTRSSMIIGLSRHFHEIISAAQICSELTPLFSATVELVLPASERDMEWLQASLRDWHVFLQFLPSIKIVRMSDAVAEGMARALQSSPDDFSTGPFRGLREIFLLTEGTTPTLDEFLISCREKGRTILLHRRGDTPPFIPPPPSGLGETPDP